ncbi:MAG: hypothetical protein QI223_06950 [Candidatus Korarchaeota archaeon]|nr:hypothetical protein [Candidatus Korarchaeota archaeon]
MQEMEGNTRVNSRSASVDYEYTFCLEGYKSYKSNACVELRDIILLIGPMGSGKSALLEAMSIFFLILSGENPFGKGEPGILKLPSHLNGVNIFELIPVENDKITAELYIRHKISGYERWLIRLEISREPANLVISVFSRPDMKALFNRTLGLNPEDDELLDLPRELARVIGSPMERFVGGVAYVSPSRPPPRDLKNLKINYSNIGKYISSDFHETGEQAGRAGGFHDFLMKTLLRRGTFGGSYERVMDILSNLIGEEQLSPGLEAEIKREGVLLSLKLGGRNLATFSTGERGIVEIVSTVEASHALGMSLLILEDPEVGIHPQKFDEMIRLILEKYYSELRENGARPLMILSTHNMLTFRIVRRLTGPINGGVSAVAYYTHITSPESGTSLVKIEIAGEAGTPSIKDLPPNLLKEIDESIEELLRLFSPKGGE